MPIVFPQTSRSAKSRRKALWNRTPKNRSSRAPSFRRQERSPAGCVAAARTHGIGEKSSTSGLSQKITTNVARRKTTRSAACLGNVAFNEGDKMSWLSRQQQRYVSAYREDMLFRLMARLVRDRPNPSKMPVRILVDGNPPCWAVHELNRIRKSIRA